MIILLKQVGRARTQEEKDGGRVRVEERLGFVGYAPVLKVSALTGPRTCTGSGTPWTSRTPTTPKRSPQASSTAPHRDARLRSHREQGTSDPAPALRDADTYRTAGFTFFANHPQLADDNFKRYLENRLRERFDFTGTPIILKFRKKD